MSSSDGVKELTNTATASSLLRMPSSTISNRIGTSDPRVIEKTWPSSKFWGNTPSTVGTWIPKPGETPTAELPETLTAPESLVTEIGPAVPWMRNVPEAPTAKTLRPWLPKAVTSAAVNCRGVEVTLIGTATEPAVTTPSESNSNVVSVTPSKTMTFCPSKLLSVTPVPAPVSTGSTLSCTCSV